MLGRVRGVETQQKLSWPEGLWREHGCREASLAGLSWDEEEWRSEGARELTLPQASLSSVAL